MPRHGQESSEAEVDAGTSEALKGALHGAATWGIPCLLGGILANAVSPVYRNLTFQFKIYLQMSGMTIGSVIEGERRLRDFQTQARRMRKLKRDQEVWRRCEQDFEEEQSK